MKILLCDDSMTVRKKLANTLLSLIPCEIVEAIDKFNFEKPDLVFMDILMPEIDGLEAVAKIITKHPAAKIIMLSSVGTKDNLQTALKLGAKDFIQKPADSKRLKIILETYREA